MGRTSTCHRPFDLCHHLRSRLAGPKREHHLLARSQYANVLQRLGFDSKRFVLTDPSAAHGDRPRLRIDRDHVRVCVPS
jgi:hypothetical protein